MFPSKKARTPTLEPPSNLQLILHHFPGQKHQMFGWKPPPSGRDFFGGFYKSPPRITWEETSRCCSFILIEQLKKTNKVWFQVLVHAGRCMRRSSTRTTRNKGAQKIKFQFGCRNSLVKCFSQLVTAAPSISWL